MGRPLDWQARGRPRDWPQESGPHRGRFAMTAISEKGAATRLKHPTGQLRPGLHAAIVAAIDGPSAGATAQAAAALTRELAAPLTFVYFRGSPEAIARDARRDRELRRARHALDVALAAAA